MNNGNFQKCNRNVTVCSLDAENCGVTCGKVAIVTSIKFQSRKTINYTDASSKT